MEKNEIVYCAVVYKINRKLIGYVGLTPCLIEDKTHYALDCLLDIPYQGKGFCLEMLKAFLGYIKPKIDMSNVIAHILSGDEKLIHITDKLNLKIFEKLINDNNEN